MYSNRIQSDATTAADAAAAADAVAATNAWCGLGIRLIFSLHVCAFLILMFSENNIKELVSELVLCY